MKTFIPLLLFWVLASPLAAQSVFHLPLNGEISPATAPQASGFAEGISGQCLDLSENAYHRFPLDWKASLPTKAISIAIWVKTEAGQEGEYVLLSNGFYGEKESSGWSLGMQEKGAWSWDLSDGQHSWNYRPTAERQAINDGQWHLLAFSLDSERKEARFYLDAHEVGRYHLGGLQGWTGGEHLHIGGNPHSETPEWFSFNGYLDEVNVWDRVLTLAELQESWQEGKGTAKEVSAPEAPDRLKVLAWNIWHGGHEHGREVGVKRVIELIKDSEADIVAMQETYGSGPEIADALGYYFYLRSSNLSIMSRFPIEESIEAYEPFRCGGAYINLGKNRKVAFFSLWIHYLPGINKLKNPDLDLDSFLVEENATRGSEIQGIIRDLEETLSGTDSIPIIMAGDYNSGSHLDWTATTRDRHYGHVFPWPVSQHMAEAGFVDAFRKVYPDPSAEPGRTWSPIFHESIQERIDYVYYQGKKLQARKARVIDRHAQRFPSDHAAIWVEFELDY